MHSLIYYFGGFITFCIPVFLVLAFIFMMGCIIYSWGSDKLKPVERHLATMIRRRMRDYEVDAPQVWSYNLYSLIYLRISRALRLDTDVVLYEWSDCFVTFSVKSQELEFIVPEEIYQMALSPVQGLLVYQGRKYKSFIVGALETKIVNDGPV